MSDDLLNPDYLRFAYPLPASILRGLKDSTVRYDLERDLSEGDRIELRNAEDMVFAHATVSAVGETAVRNAREVIDDHGGTYSRDTGGIVSALDAYYDEAITRETPVSVIVLEDVEPLGRFEEVADL